MARDPLKYFRIEAKDLLDQLGQGLLAFERGGGDAELVPRMLRLAHTLKGASRVVRQIDVADLAHALETRLGPYRESDGRLADSDLGEVRGLIGQIGARIGELSGPPVEAPVEAAATAVAAPPVEPARQALLVRAEVGEIDVLLDGLSEAGTELRALQRLGEAADELRQLSAELTMRIAAPGDAAYRRAEAMELADRAEGLATRLSEELAEAGERLQRELGGVRDAAEQLRLLPAETMLSAFERTARDAAQALNKRVLFEGDGGAIRLDAHVARLVQDAMVQLVRNAVAHGIEDPAMRAASGKSPEGRVRVSAEQAGRRLIFRCEDDGGGVDITSLKRKAVAAGANEAAFEARAASDLSGLLLDSQVSTAGSVSALAGRGIGMGVVREALAELGGSLSVETVRGQGTKFALSVPVLLSAVECLMLEAGGVAATLPLGAVRQTLRLANATVRREPAGDMLLLDNEGAVPLAPLGRLLAGSDTRRGEPGNAVVVAAGGKLAAIAVDRLLGTGDVVLRTLPAIAPVAEFISGASLDLDGNPRLMLDPEALIAAAGSAATTQNVTEKTQRPLLVIDDSLTTRMLEQSILESAGFEVDVAISGEAGLEAARMGNYALILVDVEMPGMDGFTFVETIRRDEKLKSVPAILVTSRNAPEDKQRGRDAGANDYVVKSEFDQVRLIARIRELIG